MGGRRTSSASTAEREEQTRDGVPSPKGNGYVINVASYKNGVGYRTWTHIDSWLESVIEYIRALEGTGW